MSYLKRHPRFEIPYGVAWLLQLVAELHEWDDDKAQQWRMILKPLENIVEENLQCWIEKLTVCDRTGMHKQTAF